MFSKYADENVSTEMIQNNFDEEGGVCVLSFYLLVCR